MKALGIDPKELKLLMQLPVKQRNKVLTKLRRRIEGAQKRQQIAKKQEREMKKQQEKYKDQKLVSPCNQLILQYFWQK